ncbi:MAG: D-Lactate dehydrogenase, cytochrome c-dependent, partial [uncultured Acetobacteraceae bacterium]
EHDHGPSGGRGHCRRPRVPRRAPVHGASGARAARPRRGPDAAHPARRRGLRRNHGRGEPHRRALPPARRRRDALRRRHLAGRPRQPGAARHHPRPVAHDGHPRGQPRGHGLPDRTGRHAAPAERFPARPGPVLPGRSRQPLHHRRHVRHACFRHQRRALRDHPGERAGPSGGARGRARDRDRRAGAEGRQRLRSDPADDRFRGHARRHHARQAAVARHPGSDVVRGVPVPGSQVGGGDGDRHVAIRHPRGPDGIAGRRHDGGLRPLFEAGGLQAGDHAFPGVPRQPRRRGGAGRVGGGHRRRERRRGLRLGDRRGRAQPLVEGAPRRLLGGLGAEARLEGAHHRRLRADLPLGRGARRRQGGGGGARPHHLHRRPCRRRQLPPDGALRPERPGGTGARLGDGSAHRGARLGVGRHLLGRTRRGPGQARVPGTGARGGGAGGDARHQARPRPERHPQPGQDVPEL